VLGWLDPAKHPVIVQLPQAEYDAHGPGIGHRPGFAGREAGHGLAHRPRFTPFVFSFFDAINFFAGSFKSFVLVPIPDAISSIRWPGFLPT